MIFRFSVYSRGLALLRRIARAQESIADSMKRLAGVEEQRWAKEAKLRPGKDKPKVEYEVFDQEAANKDYHQRRFEEGLEDAEGNAL